MPKLNPLAEIAAPLGRLESHFDKLEEQLSALPKLEHEITKGFQDTCALLERVVALLEEGRAVDPVAATTNSTSRKAAKR